MPLHAHHLTTATQCMAALAVLVAIAALTCGLPWIGRVTRVVDGDSVETSFLGRMRRIRLCGVDAPEYRQEHGREARRALASLVEGRLVLFVPFGRDRYGRFPCVMATSAGLVSWRMAASGDAWPESAATRIIHLPARMTRRGLWNGRQVRPAEWRRRNPRIG